MHRTYVAVALLLLAGGLSTPALVGPMLNRAPAPKLEAPESSQAMARTGPLAGERAIPQFGRDIAGRALSATPQLDGAELAQALATPTVPEAFKGFNANANGGVGGGTGWAATRRNSNNGGGSDSRVFGGGGIGSATPGLLGWGLRDSRRAEAVQRTTPPGPRQNRPSGSNSSGGSSSGGSQSESAAPAATGTTGILAGGVNAAAPGGNMPAGTPEPATLLLVSSGAAFAGLYGARRRRS